MKKLLVILAAFLLMTAPVVFADDGPPYAPQESGYSLLTSGATTEILVGGGAGIVPVWTTATGSGAPVRASDPTINGTLTVIPLGSDLYAIDVQGATNDYTGAGTLIGFKLARDINIGTGNVAGAAGWQSYLNQKHTNATLTGDRELYGGISRIDNQGSITNEGTDDWQYYSFGMHSTAKMDPGTVFDTDSTGKLEIVFAGLYGYAFGDANYTIADSGTDVPANTVIGAGVMGFVENQPTLTSGAAATIVSAAFYVDQVIGNASGTSLGAGLFIPNGVITGSDTNYGVYDISHLPWLVEGAISTGGIFTVTPDGTNEVFQVNDGTVDFSDGNGGVPGVATINAGGDMSYNKDFSADAMSASSFVTTGALTGAVGIISTTGVDLSAAQSYGYAIIVTAAGDVELADVCDSATGANVLVFVRDAAETVSVAVNDAGDTIVYPGLALGADDELDSPGSAGDFACFVCLETNTWYVIGHSPGWTDGGPAD